MVIIINVTGRCSPQLILLIPKSTPSCYFLKALSIVKISTGRPAFKLTESVKPS